MCESRCSCWESEIVKLIHLSEILLFGSVHLGHLIFVIFYLKSTSSAVRDLGGRSSSRRKDALVRCVRMCVRA